VTGPTEAGWLPLHVELGLRRDSSAVDRLRLHRFITPTTTRASTSPEALLDGFVRTARSRPISEDFHAGEDRAVLFVFGPEHRDLLIRNGWSEAAHTRIHVPRALVAPPHPWSRRRGPVGHGAHGRGRRKAAFAFHAKRELSSWGRAGPGSSAILDFLSATWPRRLLYRSELGAGSGSRIDSLFWTHQISPQEIVMRSILKAAAVAIASVLLCGQGHAQSYPTKPVTVLNSIVAGSPQRTWNAVPFGKYLEATLKQPFLVEVAAGVRAGAIAAAGGWSVPPPTVTRCFAAGPAPTTFQGAHQKT